MAAVVEPDVVGALDLVVVKGRGLGVEVPALATLLHPQPPVALSTWRTDRLAG